MVNLMKILILCILPALMAQQPEACPAPEPGVEIVASLSWAGETVPIRVSAEQSTILNGFSAKHCQKYSKDVTGELTGLKGADLPQKYWAVNLLFEIFSSKIADILQANPELKPATVKAKEAEVEAKKQEADAELKRVTDKAIQVVKQ